MLKHIPITLLLLFSFTTGAQNETFNHLKVGDKAPLFTGIDSRGKKVDLAKILEKETVVLVFYRGEWCPYCNQHMYDLQDSLRYITRKDARVIAITPEVNESIDKTIKLSYARFSIIHDKNHLLMDQYGVSFKVKSATLLKYLIMGVDLDESNENEDDTLPVPATFIINNNGIIDYIHFDENYKERSTVHEIIKHL